MSLIYLTLDDLYLGLKDLLDKRLASLTQLGVGPRYVRLLRPRYDQLATLQIATDGRPLARELSDTDVLHDALGAAIYHFTEAYRLNPLADANLRAAAAALQQRFIPALADLNRTYQDEAANAARRRPALQDAADDLAAFPLAGGGHLGQWVEAFLDAGIQLDTTLSQRASVEATRRQATSDVAGLRQRTISLLTQLRSELANERELNPDLPPDLDGLLFSYLDQLTEARLRANPPAAPAPTQPAPAPEPVEPPAPTPGNDPA